MKIYKKLIECIILLFVFILLAFFIKYYFKPFLAIVLLIILCGPIHEFLNNHKLFNTQINAIVSITIVNIIIFFSMLSIGNFVAKKLNIYIANFYDIDNISKIPIIGELNVNILLNKVNMFVDKLFNADFFTKGALYTTDSILTYFVATISVYFILVDKYDIVNLTEKLFTKNKVHMIIRKFEDIKKLIKVETFLVLITTIETIVGFFVLGINDYFMLGIICGLLDILPYVGTIIVFIPLILYRLYTRNYIVILGLIALYVFLQISRQIMEAKFMSNTLKLHPLIIIISVYIGIKIFGIIGLFIAPIYVITAKEIILS
ncbi:AI-2E family transporter [Clostridium felsineum]|uniref:Uncharacterized protein n=1 Tax=Clostridium felsineum TaxID=36839 RepID=A0A1S8L5G0_9CLOT|nr:AI-2E family transporter [Clostridium felsineum]URZ00721.1 hypothetical protein CLAUR_007090 [Clostridium felsineum]URZ06640.1 hypothetical protein CLROS_019730 [Clostridium felsineum]URZ11673.1 hypothetical protein CROST_023900 [Clostridium felsineum]URZ16231.1 hypothetical protein CLFE_022780 [Clostridium felsineum DSM 794]